MTRSHPHPSRPSQGGIPEIPSRSRGKGARFARSSGSAARLLLASLGLLLGCTDEGAGGTPGEASGDARPTLEARFDAARAWTRLETIVGFGARYSGSAANGRLRDWLVSELEALGLEPVREPFTDRTPIGAIDFENVYADLPASTAEGADAPLLVLVSHFDTKRLRVPFEGANDSGSSTAVLLELARVLSSDDAVRRTPIRFLFVDGEEAVRADWIGDDNTYGSRHHVARAFEDGTLQRMGAAVVLDMVGDANLRLTTDLASDPRLLRLFFDSARSLGLGAHVGGPAQEIGDDHVPFLDAGVPAVDLIDFEYGPENAYWHTRDDDLTNCSQDSLEHIGRIVLHALPALEDFVLGGAEAR